MINYQTYCKIFLALSPKAQAYYEGLEQRRLNPSAPHAQDRRTQ